MGDALSHFQMNSHDMWDLKKTKAYSIVYWLRIDVFRYSANGEVPLTKKGFRAALGIFKISANLREGYRFSQYIVEFAFLNALVNFLTNLICM